MNKITNHIFQSIPISLDGMHYDKCQFNDCELIYRGQDTFSLTGCTFHECRFRLDDAALNTITMLSALYHSAFHPFAAAEIERVQHGDYLPADFPKRAAVA
jgi:hypothetical protein